MVVINTLRQFATIWACMNVIGNITSALDNAHQAWKVRGIQCRPLLSLLLEFDNGQHLNDTSRERVTADVAAFSLVSLTHHPGGGHTNRLFRRFNLSQNILTLFRKYFPRFCCLQVTQIAMHHPYWRTVFGSNIGCLLTGHGKSGTIQSQVFAKYLT